MMLDLAYAFEQLVKNPKGNTLQEASGGSQITWDSPKELEAYIYRLQEAADLLTAKNRKLRK